VNIFAANLPVDNLVSAFYELDAEQTGAARFVKSGDIEGPVKSGTHFLYAHIEYSGGDGLTPPGLEIGSSPNLDVTITIRANEDPASAIIDKFSRKWRVVIRNSDG